MDRPSGLKRNIPAGMDRPSALVTLIPAGMDRPIALGTLIPAGICRFIRLGRLIPDALPRMRRLTPFAALPIRDLYPAGRLRSPVVGSSARFTQDLPRMDLGGPLRSSDEMTRIHDQRRNPPQRVRPLPLHAPVRGQRPRGPCGPLGRIAGAAEDAPRSPA